MSHFNVDDKTDTLIITLGGGFFSFCSVKLDNIIIDSISTWKLCKLN